MARLPTDDPKVTFSICLPQSLLVKFHEFIRQNQDETGHALSRSRVVEMLVTDLLQNGGYLTPKTGLQSSLEAPGEPSRPVQSHLPHRWTSPAAETAPIAFEELAPVKYDVPDFMVTPIVDPGGYRYTDAEAREIEKTDPERAEAMRRRGWVAPPIA